jgi:hypothetical protein
VKKLPIMDIGLIWAKIVNIWGQVGTIAGAVNFVMMVGVFYTTTVYPNFKIPIWSYILIIVLGAVIVIGFILKWGISGYYRYFSNQSELSEVHRKLNLVMKHLRIEDDDANKK